MMKSKGIKVLIGPSSFGVHDSSPLVYLKDKGYKIVENPYKRRLTKPELLELLADDVSGVIAGLEPFDKEVLNKTKLKVISRCGSGMSNVDLEEAKQLDIKVCYTPYGPTTAVAEVTVGAILNLLRSICSMNNNLHNRKWVKETGLQLEGKTVVVVGFGRIGRKVASLLKAFNAKVIAVDPSINSEIEGVKVKQLEAALPEADIITIHSSGEDKIIGSKEFRLMKKGTFLLNAARGSIIDEEALIQALKEEKVKGAWIDTFINEPYSGALMEFTQVILTPHIGSYTFECRRSMEMEAVTNLISAFNEESKDG